MNQENVRERTLIIISSDEPWGDVWHTQLHYAYQLSKRCIVYYISPPVKWKFRNLFLWKISMKMEKENLFVLNYLNVFPISFMSHFFVAMNDLINSLLLRRKIPENKTEIIFWKFTYYRFLHTYFIKPARTIYHVVDHYIGAKYDGSFAKKSDLVISTSPKFLDHYNRLNKNTINIPQAISSDELVCDEAIVKQLKNEYGNIILFIGTFSWDISFEIFEKISETFLTHTLLIIGPVLHAGEEESKRFDKLIAGKNVKYIGTVPGLQLKNYVKAAEVCIIPYKFSHEKKMTTRSPLKAINYIAQKKMVITSIDCEIRELENKIIYHAESLNEFMSLMQKAIDKKLIVDEKAVDVFIHKISYDTFIKSIFSRLNVPVS